MVSTVIELTGPPPTEPITEIFVWVSRESDGSEGVIATNSFLPLISSRRDLADSLGPIAQEACRLSGKPAPYLKRFECTGVVQ